MVSYHRSTLRIQTRILYKRDSINPPYDAFSLSPFRLSTVPSFLQPHQMSLLRVVVIALASLFLFSGFAVASGEDPPDPEDDKDHDVHHHDHSKIHAPKCSDKKWKWVCILPFYHSYIGHYYLICWHCVQTYNSIGQNPCKVAAYLLSTCHGGCELSSLLCLASVRLVVSSLSQRFLSQHLPRGARTGMLTRTTYASATPSYIPSLVHVKHAKRENGFSTIPSLSFFSIYWLTYLTLAIRNMWNTAKKFCLPGSEFPVASESIAFDMMIGFAASLTLSLLEQRSPNGLSLTSQFVIVIGFRRRHVLTASSRPRTIGTLSKPLQSAVGPLPYLPFLLLPLTVF